MMSQHDSSGNGRLLRIPLRRTSIRWGKGPPISAMTVIFVVLALTPGASAQCTGTQSGVCEFASPQLENSNVCTDCVACPSDLVSWWRLEGGGVSDADDEVRSNDGTFSGSPTQTSCLIGNCVQFDNNSDRISVSDDASLDIVNEVTISAWVNPTEVGFVARKIAGKHDNANFAEAYALKVKGDVDNPPTEPKRSGHLLPFAA